MKNVVGLNPYRIITAAREKKIIPGQADVSVSIFYFLIACIYLFFC